MRAMRLSDAGARRWFLRESRLESATDGANSDFSLAARDCGWAAAIRAGGYSSGERPIDVSRPGERPVPWLASTGAMERIPIERRPGSVFPREWLFSRRANPDRRASGVFARRTRSSDESRA